MLAPTKNTVIEKSKKWGIFNTIDEAKDHIQSQLNADPLKEKEENVIKRRFSKYSLIKKIIERESLYLFSIDTVMI